jgi:hypothetical protein
MTNNKQQMAVEWFFHKVMTFYVPDDLEEFEMFMEIVQQAKEMEEERMIQFACDVFDKNYKTDASFKDTAKHLYQQTYGEGEQ